VGKGGKNKKYVYIIKTMVKRKGTRSLNRPGLGFIAGVGAHVGCSSDDTSFFCRLTKFTSIISQLLFLGVIGYVIYLFIIKPYFLNK